MERMPRHVTPASSLPAGFHLEAPLSGLCPDREGLDLRLRAASAHARFEGSNRRAHVFAYESCSAPGSASSDKLWSRIRHEAQTAAAIDPIFGGALSAAVLDHADLGEAVTYQIGQRLGQTSMERAKIAQIAREAFVARLDPIEAASRDLCGIAVHDPATTALLPPLLNFKGCRERSREAQGCRREAVKPASYELN
jgi:hypothetical protein